MPNAEPLSRSDADYRSSHLEKGAHYDATLAATPFDAYMSAWERKLLPGIVQRFFPQGPARYLDFACGTGRITEQIAPLAKQSTGVDISPTMIEEARRKCPNTRFHLGDITGEDPDLGTFDLVSSFRFFGNAQHGLREAAMRAIAKRVERGGCLLINSHRNPRALYVRMQRATGGSDGGMDLHLPALRSLLAAYGFEIAHLRPIGAWMYRWRLMETTRPDDARAVRNESLFSGAWLAPIAPDVIVVARKR